jgi:hypothetical protein
MNVTVFSSSVFFRFLYLKPVLSSSLLLLFLLCDPA